MISRKLEEYLDEAGVKYKRHTHQPAYTALEIAESLHVPGREFVKSVVLKADKGPLIMAVLASEDTVNLDTLRRQIRCNVLRLATEKEFTNSFPTCKPGAMPPFGNLFGVQVYCEADLAKNREIEFNAGSHDETVRMTFKDFEDLVEPTLLHFAQGLREGMQRLAA